MTDKFIRIRYNIPSSCPRISPSRMPIEKIINSRGIKEICAGPTIYFMEIHGQDKQIPLTREQYDYIASQLVEEKIIHDPLAETPFWVTKSRYVKLQDSLGDMKKQLHEELEELRNKFKIEQEKCRPNNAPYYRDKIDVLTVIKNKLNKLLEQS